MTDKSLQNRAINFKGSSYVQVKDRVLYLAENYYGRYEIYQDYEYFPDGKMRVVKTKLIIRDEDHDENCIYEGLAQEIEGSSFINKTSALENACTSSLGRAIACLGIGVIDSFASINEIEKAENRLKDDVPFKDEKAEEKKAETWFEKTLANTKFMLECMDELDFMKKIKAGVTKIGEKMTKEQEEKLRIAYQNARALENVQNVMDNLSIDEQ